MTQHYANNDIKKTLDKKSAADQVDNYNASDEIVIHVEDHQHENKSGDVIANDDSSTIQTLSKMNETAAETKASHLISNLSTIHLDNAMRPPVKLKSKQKVIDSFFTSNFPPHNKTVVVFFHLGKTGGSTIKSIFERSKGTEYKFVTGLSGWNKTEKEVNKWFKSIEQGKGHDFVLKFIEIHGFSPSFMSLRETMKQWRETSAKANINFFLFTMVRNPISLSFSMFNDHCTKRKKCKIEHLKQPRIKSFLQMDWVNQQNKYFLDGWNVYYNNRMERRTGNSPSERVSRNLFHEMTSYFDWVGTTECLSTDTLRILKKINPLLTDDNFEHSNVANQSLPGFITKDMLDEASMKYLKDITLLDSRLYNELVSHYGSKCF